MEIIISRKRDLYDWGKRHDVWGSQGGFLGRKVRRHGSYSVEKIRIWVSWDLWDMVWIRSRDFYYKRSNVCERWWSDTCRVVIFRIDQMRYSDPDWDCIPCVVHDLLTNNSIICLQTDLLIYESPFRDLASRSLFVRTPHFVRSIEDGT